MSLSVNTNLSAMVALETLNATQTQLSQTENAVSTGKKVSTAADNAAAFGISQQMQGNVSGQSAVNDGLSFAAQIVSNTTSAANSIITVLQEVQKAVTSLGSNYGNATSLNQVGQQITGYLQQIDTIAQTATTNGVNLLSGSTTDGLGITTNSLQYVTGLQGSTATITGFNSSIVSNANTLNGTAGPTASIGTSLTDALGLTSAGGTAGASPTSNVFVTSSGTLSGAFSGAGTGAISAMIAQVQHAITAMANVTSSLGANSNVISSMMSYGQNVSDNLTAGIGALTDADMSAESAQLTSLQTKQSLAIKSLTIANGQSQNILSLFQ
ncbi:flagellin [Gluconacetobacter johannae]|uniref:Flagellin n=1 Tax=Gluconacetobacter johannae TaxID=112140 RepID=A0A7W4P5E7_9PROT|nr:flagellin [Gluconacetobacter johannae]MBB2176083.1 flagellin [Gluconacetobacter johannae]